VPRTIADVSFLETVFAGVLELAVVSVADVSAR